MIIGEPNFFGSKQVGAIKGLCQLDTNDQSYRSLYRNGS